MFNFTRKVDHSKLVFHWVIWFVLPVKAENLHHLSTTKMKCLVTMILKMTWLSNVCWTQDLAGEVLVEIMKGMQALLVLVAYQMVETLEPVLLRSAFVGMVMMETGLMMVDVTSSVKYSDETDLKVVSLCH